LPVGVVAHGGEHDVGQPPFEAAQGFASGFARRPFAFVVGAPSVSPRIWVIAMV
jgi:hypothetical protein